MTESGDFAEVPGIGIPDRWQRLWAPHRMAYLKGENRPLIKDSITCPFCEIPQRDDESGLIVAREKYNYVVLNLYPYNPGHLLICAYRHVAQLPELTTDERNEMTEIAAHTMEVLRKVSNPEGFNLGMNQGPISGAGVADHIHQHVIPRWSGDANFMPLIGGTKVLPRLLDEVRAELAAAW